MVMVHSVIAFWHHFHPRSTKNMDLETFPSSPPQITENRKIVPKVCSRRVPKSNQKSLKSDIWASVWPLGVSLNPRTTKMVSQVRKKTTQGLQNTSLKRKIDHCINQPVSQPSPILQFAINTLTNLLLPFSCLLLAVGGQKATKCELNLTPGTLNYRISRKSEITQNTWFL